MRRHLAVRWDGKKIAGGVPSWVRVAVGKIPLSPNALVRVHGDVHVFGPQGKLRAVARPGDWILYEPLSGEMIVRTHGEMQEQWEFRDSGFFERERSVVPVAGTEQRLENGLRVLAGWTVVSMASHPRLHEAFSVISHDRGSGAGHATYAVVPEWVHAINVAEGVLAGLCEEDRETLCIGEESEQATIAALSEAHDTTSRMLGAFFEDWEQ